MSFTPKRIFLADDDSLYREKIKKALTEAGHEVVVEASSGQEALSLVDEAVEKGIEVAVLDCYMPEKKDGAEVAGVLNQKLPNLIVASVSSMWNGVWDDPNFDESKPYHADLKDYDVNGRRKFRRPDIFLEDIDYNLKNLAELIGNTEFSIRDEKELSELPRLLEFVQRGRERK